MGNARAKANKQGQLKKFDFLGRRKARLGKLARLVVFNKEERR